MSPTAAVAVDVDASRGRCAEEGEVSRRNFAQLEIEAMGGQILQVSPWYRR